MQIAYFCNRVSYVAFFQMLSRLKNMVTEALRHVSDVQWVNSIYCLANSYVLHSYLGQELMLLKPYLLMEGAMCV